jgi:hypothetical protein
MLEGCLGRLEDQRDRAEVVVCGAQTIPDSLSRRFGWAEFITRPDATVPVLWREGIDRSCGEIVALTISSMQAAPDWIATMRAHHTRHDALAGAIEPGERLRLSDWAEYFCRYSHDMLPFAAHECPDLPGDNASYKRALLEQTRDLYRDGFWEPVVHRRLVAHGVRLWHLPDVVVRQGRSAGARAFARQRLVHGRAHGRQRGERFGRARNLLGVLGAPLVPPLLALRVLRGVARRGRLRTRALASLPLMTVFNVVWALGEARGHLDALRTVPPGAR